MMDKPVTEIMSRDVHSAPPNTTLKDAERLLHEYRVEKLPLVDKDGKVAGLVTLKDIMKITQFPKATKDSKGRLAVGAAVGVRDKEMRRVEAVLEAGADCIVVDIAHGDSHLEVEMIKNIRKHFPDAQIIGGNVATADGTKRLIDAGVGRGESGRGSWFDLHHEDCGWFRRAAVDGCHRMCRSRALNMASRSLRTAAFVSRAIWQRPLRQVHRPP